MGIKKKFLKVPLFIKNPGSSGGFFTKDWFPLNVIILAILGGGIGLLIWFLTKPKPPKCKTGSICGTECCTYGQTCCGLMPNSKCIDDLKETCINEKPCLKGNTTIDEHSDCCTSTKPIPGLHKCYGCPTKSSCWPVNSHNPFRSKSPSLPIVIPTSISPFSPSKSQKSFSDTVESKKTCVYPQNHQSSDDPNPFQPTPTNMACTLNEQCVLTPAYPVGGGKNVCCPKELLDGYGDCCMGDDNIVCGKNCCTKPEFCCPKTGECCIPGQKCTDNGCKDICNLGCNTYNSTSCPEYNGSCCPSNAPQNSANPPSGCYNCCDPDEICNISENSSGKPISAKCDKPTCILDQPVQFQPDALAVWTGGNWEHKVLQQPMTCTGPTGDCAYDSPTNAPRQNGAHLYKLCENPNLKFNLGNDNSGIYELTEETKLSPAYGSCAPDACDKYLINNSGNQGHSTTAGISWDVVDKDLGGGKKNPEWGDRITVTETNKFITSIGGKDIPKAGENQMSQFCAKQTTGNQIASVNKAWKDWSQSHSIESKHDPCLNKNLSCFGKGTIHNKDLAHCPDTLPPQGQMTPGDRLLFKNRTCSLKNWQFDPNNYLHSKNPNPKSLYTGYNCAHNDNTFCGYGKSVATDRQNSVNCYNGFLATYDHTLLSQDGGPAVPPSKLEPWYITSDGTPGCAIPGREKILYKDQCGMPLDDGGSIYPWNYFVPSGGNGAAQIPNKNTSNDIMNSNARIFIPWSDEYGDSETSLSDMKKQLALKPAPVIKQYYCKQKAGPNAFSPSQRNDSIHNKEGAPDIIRSVEWCQTDNNPGTNTCPPDSKAKFFSTEPAALEYCEAADDQGRGGLVYPHQNNGWYTGCTSSIGKGGVCNDGLWKCESGLALDNPDMTCNQVCGGRYAAGSQSIGKMSNQVNQLIDDTCTGGTPDGTSKILIQVLNSDGKQVRQNTMASENNTCPCNLINSADSTDIQCCTAQQCACLPEGVNTEWSPMKYS